jgi:hypothetical protein
VYGCGFYIRCDDVRQMGDMNAEGTRLVGATCKGMSRTRCGLECESDGGRKHIKPK